MDLVAEMHAIAKALDVAGVDYAVCGGVAVTAYGAPRSTDDLDIIVDPEDVARVLDAVRPLGYLFVALPLHFDPGTEKERVVQRVTKVEAGQHLMLDILSACGPFVGALAETVRVRLPEGELTLVSRATLERMKRLAGRPKDLADLEALEKPDEQS